MENHVEQPKIVGEFGGARSSRIRAWTLAGIGLWLAFLGVEWAARFWVFRWQDQWLPMRPATAEGHGAASPAASARWTVPAQMGADLSRMVPSRRIARRYEEYHAEYEGMRDEWGYRNDGEADGGHWPIVMLGDSFLLLRGTQDVAQALSAQAQIPVYNHARQGAGPFLEMQNFLLADRFDPAPRVVVWSLSARELGAPMFLRQPVEGWFAKVDVWAEPKTPASRQTVRYRNLAPRELSKAWPNTSIAAYLGRRAWAKIKLSVLGGWPADVLGGDDPQFGPMLFYRENLRILPLITPEVDAPAVISTAKKVADGFRARNIRLVVMLVPEKEQVHAEALPAEQRAALGRGPEMFGIIERAMEEHGVPTVNLYPTFRAATASGRRLYWRDDTHWNDEGIRLAAELLRDKVEPLLR